MQESRDTGFAVISFCNVIPEQVIGVLTLLYCSKEWTATYIEVLRVLPDGDVIKIADQ